MNFLGSDKIALITGVTGQDGSYLTEFTHYHIHQPMLSHINVGTGVDCTICELAETLARVTGFKGELVFDQTKPDGTPRKLMDVSRLKSLGWQASISLEAGLRATYEWFLAHQSDFRS